MFQAVVARLEMICTAVVIAEHGIDAMTFDEIGKIAGPVRQAAVIAGVGSGTGPSVISTIEVELMHPYALPV
ncbi:hypothetical protein GCM10022394_04320 [Zobellella aerophila]|uniref:Uncharacterized protein n=1 Tax=Zobellella aerophila TaxID=870480 RepID=A0ABP6V8I5_9GAMM